MTDDKKSKEASGVYVVKEQEIERIHNDPENPASGLTSSVTTSWLEQQRLKQLGKETQQRKNLANEKKELNVALADLAESEIHKNIALANLEDMPQKIAKGRARRDIEEEMIDIEQDTELEKAKMANIKAQRKRLEEERRLREEEEGG